MLGVHAEVSAVEQGVDIGSEQQPVVEPVLPSLGDRADVSRLQDRRDVRAADGAAPVVGVQDDRLEGLLAEPVWRQPQVAEHRPGPVPGLMEVQFHRDGGAPVPADPRPHLLDAGDFTPVDLSSADYARMADLVTAYESLPLGTTDASVIAIAERFGLTDVATLDRRHFTVVRPKHVDALTLLP